MNRPTNNKTLTILFVIVIIALYITGLVVTESSDNIWYDIVAALLLLTTAIYSGKIFDNFESGIHIITPLLFLLLALSNPQNVRFSLFQPAVLALTAACHYDIRFYASEANLLNTMKSNLALSIASLCYAPCAWLLPVFILLNITYSDNKAKFVFTSLLSFGIPFIIIYAVIFLTKDSTAAAALPATFWKNATEIPKKEWFSPILTVIRALTIVIISIISAISSLHGLERCSTLKYKSIIRLDILMPIMAAFFIIFSANIPSLLASAAYMPAAILIEEAAENTRKTKNVNLITTIVLLLIIAERTIYFI